MNEIMKMGVIWCVLYKIDRAPSLLGIGMCMSFFITFCDITTPSLVIMSTSD